MWMTRQLLCLARSTPQRRVPLQQTLFRQTTVSYKATMGKCISRRECPKSDDETATEAKDEVKNNSVEAKAKNDKTVNGQVDVKETEEICETQIEPNVQDASSDDKKSESIDDKSKSDKETKAVLNADAHENDQKLNEEVQMPKEEAVDVDLNDPGVQKAATTIQASFRGHITRKQLKESKEPNQETANANEVDIDINDPEVNKAALKIQSSFRGHLTRKQLQEK